MPDPNDPRFGTGNPGEAPFIHPPDELNDDPKNGLYCFMDNTRQCGADCMAYTAYTPEPKTTELGMEGRNCSVLVNIERLGIHSVIGVGVLAKGAKAKKIAEADRARAAQQQPPSPTGGK